MLGQLLLQLVLILLNAYFAATEIAVISLNEKKLKLRAEDGDKKARRMLKMIEEPTQFLSTIQIGITLAGFLIFLPGVIINSFFVKISLENTLLLIAFFLLEFSCKIYYTMI